MLYNAFFLSNSCIMIILEQNKKNIYIIIKLKINSPRCAISSLLSPFCDTSRAKRESFFFFLFLPIRRFFSSFFFGVYGSRISWIFWLFIGSFYLFIGPYFDICGPFVFTVRCAIFNWSMLSPSIVPDCVFL